MHVNSNDSQNGSIKSQQSSSSIRNQQNAQGTNEYSPYVDQGGNLPDVPLEISPVENIATIKDFAKGTLSEYRIKQIEQSPLFQKIYSSQQDGFKEEKGTQQSILVTGFGMRNLKSLQDALSLQEDERKR